MEMKNIYIKLWSNDFQFTCREEGKWSSQGAATFGFSFALVVIAAGIYLLDIAIIYVATKDPYRNKKVDKFISENIIIQRIMF